MIINDDRLPALYSYLRKSKRKRDAGRHRSRRKARLKKKLWKSWRRGNAESSSDKITRKKKKVVQPASAAV